MLTSILLPELNDCSACVTHVHCRQQLAQELGIRKQLRADHVAAVAARRSAQEAAQQQRWQNLVQKDVLRAEARAAAAREVEEAEAERARYGCFPALSHTDDAEDYCRPPVVPGNGHSTHGKLHMYD
jgi:hypothetical protein